MSEFSWYVYQSGQQMGPFSDVQVRQLLTIKMISQDAFIFKDGWEDWRSIAEVFGADKSPPPMPAPPQLDADNSKRPQRKQQKQVKQAKQTKPTKQTRQKNQSKQQRMARVGIRGRVIAHNNGRVIISGGINISASGIFVETEVENNQLGFQVGEQIKLTIKADDLSYPFNVVAEMMRFNTDSSNHPTGYGMKFIDLPEEIKADIERLANTGTEMRKASGG